MEREDEERRLRREMRRIKRKKEERIRQLILAGFFTAALCGKSMQHGQGKPELF